MALSEPVIDLDTARELLRRAVPTWVEFLGHLEASGGRLKFRSELRTTIANLRIDNYPLLYENPASIGSVLMQAFMDKDEITAFNSELENATLAGRGQILVSLVRDLDDLDGLFEFPETADDKQHAIAAFETLDTQTREKTVVSLN